jgi:hypothetical protein
MNKLFTLFVFIFSLTNSINVSAQGHTNQDKFKQLGTELPTPNVYRTASGAPGYAYWQQQADYVIKLELNDVEQKITGSETITYTNNSPDHLSYIWIQLDQNMRAKGSDTYKIKTSKIEDKMTTGSYTRLFSPDFDGGFKLEKVTDASGNDLSYTINKTMMRIDLKEPLKPKSKFVFKISWWYNINNRMEIGGRSGYEYFEEDGNYLYTIAQFYPRLAVYKDDQGWQHKQFLGRGEFALTFGDFDVSITVPDDFIVGATGQLQNTSEVLSKEEQNRYKEAKKSNEPVIIVTQKEAIEKEKNPSTDGKKTWHYKAVNVRDFGFAASRKFIWDAVGVQFGDRTVMAMSYYPKEGNPLWEQYSTRVVAHTIRTYSQFTFDYPYPVAISVHSKWIGMEYPMICFNGGRPEPDGTYSERTKYSLIGVVTHEVGHNFFPMIVNSDERQWTWMDEGLNTFIQYLTQQKWEANYPGRGSVKGIVDYMGGDQKNLTPIMTSSLSLYNFGANAYAKPTAGLLILRETILGRELFDYAFKEYANRWKFKHPSPADFFRTMEDASGTDLDWFWRGWFYTTDFTDIALKDVKLFSLNTHDPAVEADFNRNVDESEPESITTIRNREEGPSEVEKNSTLLDFYSTYDKYAFTVEEEEAFNQYKESLSAKELASMEAYPFYYQLTFENLGGLVMPLIIEFTYADKSKEVIRIPAQIWRMNRAEISKVFPTKKEVISIALDPFFETADVNMSNNYWPLRIVPTRFDVYKSEKRGSSDNPMKKAQKKGAE